MSCASGSPIDVRVADMKSNVGATRGLLRHLLKCGAKALLAKSSDEGTVLDGYVCGQEGQALSTFAEPEVRKHFEQDLREKVGGR